LQHFFVIAHKARAHVRREGGVKSKEKIKGKRAVEKRLFLVRRTKQNRLHEGACFVNAESKSTTSNAKKRENRSSYENRSG
jgi:hypothetical protein